MKKHLCLPLAVSLFFYTTQSLACNFSNEVFNNLDFGLYWFDADNNCEKATPGQANSYYDSHKKTIIYIHGWQQGTTQERDRSSFVFADSGLQETSLSAFWTSRGYNVGILYWNQFADEAEVKDAEAKIWSASGPKSMRWLSADGTYHAGPDENITQLLFESYRDNLTNYSGPEIRLAGHSLGNQLAITLTHKLYNSDIPNNLKPKRIALLDPFYSNGEKDYLNGEWNGQLARTYVAELKGLGAIFEAYRSSAVSNTVFVGDANQGLLDMTAFVELRPWYFNPVQLSEKHSDAVWHYFWSIDFAAPALENSELEGQSASSSNALTQQHMDANYRLVHSRGMFSKNPVDDEFKREH